jgi:hypothetical protein
MDINQNEIRPPIFSEHSSTEPLRVQQTAINRYQPPSTAMIIFLKNSVVGKSNALWGVEILGFHVSINTYRSLIKLRDA